MRDYGKKGKGTTMAYSEGGKVLRTEEMPSGAQQWVREHPTRGKLGTISEHDMREGDKAIASASARPKRKRTMPAMNSAYMDELAKIRADRRKK